MNEHPRKIGKYDVIDVLGRGAMGVVYRAHDPYVDRPVAIKLATHADADNEGVARRLFINEARSAGRLDHPHVLKVYEAGEDAGQPYMVMEYIAGGDTLRNYCRVDTLLPIPTVIRIIRQTADALDYAHRHGVLHRDIKPANVMLTKDGNAKLGDFGIARRMGADQTQIVGWFGSPLYMSPEQARDAEITPQSDLFSLGSVFYEMLTGTPPFAAKGLTGLIHKVCNEDPVPLREVRPEVPEQLWPIVRKLLEKDLGRRYRTGGELVRDLDALLEDARNLPLVLDDDQKLQRLADPKSVPPAPPAEWTPERLRDRLAELKAERRKAPMQDLAAESGMPRRTIQHILKQQADAQREAQRTRQALVGMASHVVKGGKRRP